MDTRLVAGGHKRFQARDVLQVLVAAEQPVAHGLHGLATRLLDGERVREPGREPPLRCRGAAVEADGAVRVLVSILFLLQVRVRLDEVNDRGHHGQVQEGEDFPRLGRRPAKSGKKKNKMKKSWACSNSTYSVARSS